MNILGLNFHFSMKSIFKSLFKYEKHENRSELSTQNITQNNIIVLQDNQIAKEVINSLPKSRQKNVSDIISDAERKLPKTDDGQKNEIPEPSWLGNFIDSCKDVYEEDLQSIWSDILSRKVNKRQNTSVRTMSILKNITSSDANLFHRFLKYKINGFVYYQEGKMPQDFPTFDEISLLLEIGLVKQMINVVQIVRFIPIHQFGLDKFGYIGEYYGYILFVHFNAKEREIKIPGAFLSTAGVELSHFVNHRRDNNYLSCLSKFLKSRNLQLKGVPGAKEGGQNGFNLAELEDID